MKIKSIIFITGHRKSGTTLLLSLLDSHPKLRVFPVDLTFFYSYFPSFVKKHSKNKKKLISKILDIYKFNFLNLSFNQNYSKIKINKSLRNLKTILKKINLLSKKDVLQTIIAEWKRLNKFKDIKKLVIKETTQAMYFQKYLKIFNDIRMINIVRDPRDNYASIKSGQKKYYSKINENEVTSLASFLFRSKLDLSTAKLLINEKKFLTIKYENLVKNTNKEMKKVAKFIGVKYEQILSYSTILGEKYYGNNFNKKIFKIDNANVNNWKKRISQEEAKIIEFFLSEEMKDWGYEASFNKKDTISSYSKFYEKINDSYFFNDSIKYNLKKNT